MICISLPMLFTGVYRFARECRIVYLRSVHFKCFLKDLHLAVYNYISMFKNIIYVDMKSPREMAAVWNRKEAGELGACSWWMGRRLDRDGKGAEGGEVQCMRLRGEAVVRDWKGNMGAANSLKMFVRTWLEEKSPTSHHYQHRRKPAVRWDTVLRFQVSFCVFTSFPALTSDHPRGSPWHSVKEVRPEGHLAGSVVEHVTPSRSEFNPILGVKIN